jgi:hypothetical protein
MNAVRIFLALVMTAVCTMTWRNVLTRIALERNADAMIAQAAAERGMTIEPGNVPKLRDFVIPHEPSVNVLMLPALATTFSSALAWALTIYAARRAERQEAAADG